MVGIKKIHRIMLRQILREAPDTYIIRSRSLPQLEEPNLGKFSRVNPVSKLVLHCLSAHLYDHLHNLLFIDNELYRYPRNQTLTFGGHHVGQAVNGFPSLEGPVPARNANFVLGHF